MNKQALLIVLLSLLGAAHVSAQTDTVKVTPETEKQEGVKPEVKPRPAVKVVPAARDNKAKPAKVSSAKPPDARPGGSRPARNSRPANRPVRPGAGRN